MQRNLKPFWKKYVEYNTEILLKIWKYKPVLILSFKSCIYDVYKPMKILGKESLKYMDFFCSAKKTMDDKWKTLESAAFHDTVLTSRCHRTILRRIHAGTAMVSRSRVAFLRPSGAFGKLLVSFVLSSWDEKRAKAPMITRRKNEDYTISKDALTMDFRKAKWTYE